MLGAHACTACSQRCLASHPSPSCSGPQICQLCDQAERIFQAEPSVLKLRGVACLAWQLVAACRWQLDNMLHQPWHLLNATHLTLMVPQRVAPNRVICRSIVQRPSRSLATCTASLAT